MSGVQPPGNGGGSGGGSGSNNGSGGVTQNVTHVVWIQWSLPTGGPTPSYFEVIGYYTPAAWAASTAYTLNAVVLNGGNVYQCLSAGTSASSGGPSGTGNSITDGSCTWSYEGVVGANCVACWIFGPVKTQDGMATSLQVKFDTAVSLTSFTPAVRAIYNGTAGPGPVKNRIVSV